MNGFWYNASNGRLVCVLNFSYLKCLHSWHSISNFRKDLCYWRGLVNFLCSILIWTFHLSHLFAKLEMQSCTIWLCRPVCCVVNKTWWRSLVAHFICSFLNHKMRFSLLFIFKVHCTKYHQGLARKRFRDIHTCNQPDAQKHAVVTFSFTGM